MAASRKKKPAGGKSQASKTSGEHQGTNLTINQILLHVRPEKSDRVLEVGCGEGRVARELARRAGYVNGVDIADEYLAAAQAQILQSGLANLSFQCIEPDCLPFDDNAFDFVCSQGSLHRFPERQKIVREMVRVLKPSGLLCLADAIGSEDEGRRVARLKLEQVRYGQPVSLLTLTELRALVEGKTIQFVGHAQWEEKLAFADWLGPSGPDPSGVERLFRMLTVAAKKKSTDLKIEIAGKTLTLERRWALVTAEKIGDR